MTPEQLLAIEARARQAHAYLETGRFILAPNVHLLVSDIDVLIARLRLADEMVAAWTNAEDSDEYYEHAQECLRRWREGDARETR